MDWFSFEYIHYEMEKLLNEILLKRFLIMAFINNIYTGKIRPDTK